MSKAPLVTAAFATLVALAGSPEAAASPLAFSPVAAKPASEMHGFQKATHKRRYYYREYAPYGYYAPPVVTYYAPPVYAYAPPPVYYAPPGAYYPPVRRYYGPPVVYYDVDIDYGPRRFGPYYTGW